MLTSNSIYGYVFHQVPTAALHFEQDEHRALNFLVCEEYGPERTKHRQRKVGEQRLCTEKVEAEEHHEEKVEAVQTRAHEVQYQSCPHFSRDRQVDETREQ